MIFRAHSLADGMAAVLEETCIGEGEAGYPRKLKNQKEEEEDGQPISEIVSNMQPEQGPRLMANEEGQVGCPQSCSIGIESTTHHSRVHHITYNACLCAFPSIYI
jgi:hypothetical protein